MPRSISLRRDRAQGFMLLIAAAAFLAAGAPIPADAAPATIYNLGTFGGNQSYGFSINASGQVAGRSNFPNGLNHAYRYTGIPGSGGMMEDLRQNTWSAYGQAINDSGQVAGYAPMDNSPRNVAFLYTGTPGSGGTMAFLGTLGGGQSFGQAVNNAGQVAGTAETTNLASQFHAYRYSGTPGAGGSMADLGTLAGGAESWAYGINASGQVVGWSYTNGTATQHVFRYTGIPGSGGAMADLGTLGGNFGEGLGINSAGQVTGDSRLSSGASRAFLYTDTPGAGGLMVDLGTLGGNYSGGFGIDTAGHIVGGSTTAGNVGHAFLYTGTPGSDGTMIDLDTWLDANNPTEGAKWTLTEALAISDTGLITGDGIYNDGTTSGTRAFLLDASSLVPEPSGFSLLALGWLACLRRHRRA